MTEGETAAPTAAPADAPPNHTVYAKNLNDKVKAERMKASLYAAFSAHGKVLEVVMSGARRLRGQAWVTFDDVASASAALRALNGALVFDKPLVLQFGRDKADVIARRDGSFVPREKRKREAAASTVKQEPSTAKRPSHEGAGAPPPPPPPPKQAAAPNKILFLQDLPESCNQEMLGVLFKQYHGFKVRSLGFCSWMLECSLVLWRGRRCASCPARRDSRSSSSVTRRRPPSRARDSPASSSRPPIRCRSRSPRSERGSARAARRSAACGRPATVVEINTHTLPPTLAMNATVAAAATGSGQGSAVDIDRKT